MVDRLSYSQLNGWAGCGERYRLARIVRVPQTPSWATIGGSSVHAQTEQVDLLGLGVAHDRNESFAETFERLTATEEERSGMDRSQFRASGRRSKEWPDKETAAWWLQNGPVMVNRWIAFTQNSPWDIWITPDGKPAVELDFNLPLSPDGRGWPRIEDRGFIDRVMVHHDSGALIVLDIKSGSSKQVVPRQLGTYKVGLKDKYGVDARFGAFWDARTGITSEVYDLNEFDLARITWQFEQLAKAREAGIYLPNPGPLCGSCSVNSYCYEYTAGASAAVRPPWVPADDWELTA